MDEVNGPTRKSANNKTKSYHCEASQWFSRKQQKCGISHCCRQSSHHALEGQTPSNKLGNNNYCTTASRHCSKRGRHRYLPASVALKRSYCIDL